VSAHSKRLDVDQVHVFRGDRHVLRGVSLRLDAGELVHVRGPNGTGKTTLLRVASGLLRPEQGKVTWDGRAIMDTRSEYQRELAFASHEPALKSDLTGVENLRFTVGLKRRVTDAELRAALERAGVAACAPPCGCSMSRSRTWTRRAASCSRRSSTSISPRAARRSSLHIRRSP
jgi:heme exporter protein A